MSKKQEKQNRMELLLFKWKRHILNKDDRMELIGLLKEDAEKRRNKDRWGAMVEFGLIRQLQRGKK